MGLCNLRHINDIISTRKKISIEYDKVFQSLAIKRPTLHSNITRYNYSYYAVIFESETQLIDIKNTLEKNNMFPRRYFYPSLNTIPYFNINECQNSKDISERILCLPCHYQLKSNQQKMITEKIYKRIN